jgi:hypothetical protein
MGNMVIKGGKGQAIGMKMAKQPSKGGPRDGCFRDIAPAKDNPGNPYTNPAKADKTMQGTPAVKGKLG